MPQKHSPAENLYSVFYSVRRKLNEVSASYWTDLEIFGWINKAQLYIVRKSKCLKKIVTVTTTEGTREYDLRSTTNGFDDIIDISEDGVEFNTNGSKRLPLIYTTIWKLNHGSPGWRDVANSIPQEYYWNKSTKTIGLYPEPNSSNAGAYLYVSGYHKPKTLIAGTVSSGSTTTLVMAEGSSTVPYPNPTDDYYNDLYVEIYSGTGAGQKLKITDYAASTRTLTFATATAPDSTSVFGMVFEVPEEAHYLTELYTLWKAYSKGGSRVNLANNYRAEFFGGLSEFIGEELEAEAEELVKDTYR